MRQLMEQEGLPWRVYWRWRAMIEAQGDRLVSVRLKDYLRALRAREAQGEAIDTPEGSE
jgi:hypothetical protein